MITTPKGQSAQDPNRPATLAAALDRINELGGALECADALSQDVFTSIKTVARLVLLALESPAAHSRNAADLIPDALRLVWSLSDQAMDSINSTAGHAGHSFADLSEDERDTARRTARSAAVLDLAGGAAA